MYIHSFAYFYLFIHLFIYYLFITLSESYTFSNVRKYRHICTRSPPLIKQFCLAQYQLKLVVQSLVPTVAEDGCEDQVANKQERSIHEYIGIMRTKMSPITIIPDDD